MKRTLNKLQRSVKRSVVGLLISLSMVSVTTAGDFIFVQSSFNTYAADQGLAKFAKLESGDKNWEVTDAKEGGIGTFKSVNGEPTYRIKAKMSDYTYKEGNLLSIKIEGVDISEEEVIIGYGTSNGEFIKLKQIDSQHIGYITFKLPADEEGVLKSKAATLVRIKGKYRNVTKGSKIVCGGFEIHKKGTLPSWDDGSYPMYYPYATPKGIAVTYYDGIYSRGFAWSTDSHTSESYLYIIKASSGMNKDNIDWSQATKQKASLTKRTDKNGDVWHVYKAHVKDLSKGKTYYYKVGNEKQGFSDVGTVNVEKSESEIDGTTFVHLTDCQESYKNGYMRWAEVLRDAKAKAPNMDFVAFTGDLTNDSHESLDMTQWIWGLDEPKDNLLNLPISPASGNHDSFDYSFVDRFDFNYADYLSGSNDELLTGGCYYYKYGKDILSITLNTNESSGSGFKNQENWVRSILKKNKDCKWKIVQIHKGVMSTGDHTNSGDVKQFREKLPKIFAEYKVDLVLQGHDHVYTRTKPYLYGVKEDGENYTGHIAIDEPGVVTKDYEFDGEKRIWNLEPEGTHYVTINYCANKKYAVEDYDKDIIKPGINPIKGKDGCCVQPEKPMYGIVRIKDGKLCYDAYTYDYDTKKRELFDTFSVDKSEKVEPGDVEPGNNEPGNNEPGNIESENNSGKVEDSNNQNDTKSSSENNKTDKENKENKNDSTGAENKNDELKKKSVANNKLHKGLVFKDKKTKAVYKITKLKKNKKNGKITGGTVTLLRPIKKNIRKFTIKKFVKYEGVKFRVNRIHKKAFKKCKKLKLIIVKAKISNKKVLKKLSKKVKIK